MNEINSNDDVKTCGYCNTKISKDEDITQLISLRSEIDYCNSCSKMLTKQPKDSKYIRKLVNEKALVAFTIPFWILLFLTVITSNINYLAIATILLPFYLSLVFISQQ